MSQYKIKGYNKKDFICADIKNIKKYEFDEQGVAHDVDELLKDTSIAYVHCLTNAIQFSFRKNVIVNYTITGDIGYSCNIINLVDESIQNDINVYEECELLFIRVSNDKYEVIQCSDLN